jgi:4-coumarate--CoA ligase
MSGAAPLGAGLVSAFREKLAAQGGDVAVSQGMLIFSECILRLERLRLSTGYGLTETSPTMMIVPRQYTVAKIGSAGTLMAGLEVRLVGEDDEDTPVGGPGEIWVRGPSIMKVFDIRFCIFSWTLTWE